MLTYANNIVKKYDNADANSTPPRTPRISRLKSQILKPTFLS